MNELRNNGFRDSAPMVSEEIRRTDTGFGEKHVLNDNGGLSGFHHFEEEEKGSNKAKLMGGALVVALLLGAAGIYTYTGSAPTIVASKAPASSVVSNTPAPIQTAPMTAPATAPDASGMTAKSPYDAAPAASAPSDTASTAPDVKADKPVKSARARTVKDDAAQNTAEAGQTAQLNKDNSAADRATKNGSVAVPLATPLPTPPAPPASSVASTGQPVAPEASAPEASAPAQDIPAAPAVTPEQQPAQAPAPQPDQAAQPQVQPQ